jgi:hypothetical protein
MSVRATLVFTGYMTCWVDPRAGLEACSFRDQTPISRSINPVARSFCRLKYSGYFYIKNKLYLTADNPFYFRSTFQVDFSKGPPKSCRHMLLKVSISANSFTMRKVNLEDHPLPGVCHWICNTFAGTLYNCRPYSSSATELNQHIILFLYNQF